MLLDVIDGVRAARRVFWPQDFYLVVLIALAYC